MFCYDKRLRNAKKQNCHNSSFVINILMRTTREENLREWISGVMSNFKLVIFKLD